MMLVAVCLSGCSAPNNAKKAETVFCFVKDGMDYTAKSVEPLLDKIEKERLVVKDEDLDYPEGYDPYNPIANGEFTEEDWAAIQQEEAMNSLAQDAMRDFYEERPDVSDRVIKP